MATAQTEIKVTPEIAAEHGVTREEYARIQEILGRDPNITELGIFSVMWSEHCSYKSSKVHLKRLPTRGKLVVQGPGENAGVVDIGDGLVAAFKIESHNHPSYVEPFQGATTGVGGILRDIFTMGARPIAVLDSLRFGEITPSRRTSNEEAAKNRRILDGVIRGIGSYGNCFGVPTVGGEVAFEPCYSQNPLVNALALGIARKEDLFFAKAKGAGNPVIYVGAKTGRDGIHGASLLASAEFTEQSQQKRPNVEVGRVTADGRTRIKMNGSVAADIPAHPLAEEGPVYRRPIAPPAPRVESEKDWFPFAPETTNLTQSFLQLLASPALASKRWITEQYDTSVRTNTLAGPGASDAAVVRIKDPKTNEVKRALALSTDGNGRWCQLHPRLAAMHAVAEAARNVAASGARPVAATNCLNFGSPEKPEVMWQFSQVIDGIAEASTALGAPITGGNVSFYNETLGKSIYPTPVIGMLGILDDVSRVLEIGFRNPGDVILFLDGSNTDARARGASSAVFSREFSSSEYSKTVGGIVAGEPPTIELDAEMRLIDCLVALASEGAARSAHDLSDGGLALAVAECCFASSSLAGARQAAPPLGANVSVDDPAPAEYALFGERGARAIVSVSPENLAAVLTIARQYGMAAREIGRVTRGDAFRIEQRGYAVIKSTVETLRDAWANSLEQWLGIRK